RPQKLYGAESPPHVPALARSNPGSQSSHEQRLGARYCRISQEKLQQPAVSASPTATDESRKAIEQVIAMKRARAVWTLVAKVKYSAAGGSDGRSEPQRNRWQKAARSDAEASREKLLQRTHELRRERPGDHPQGFAPARQSPGGGKQNRRRGGG